MLHQLNCRSLRLPLDVLFSNYPAYPTKLLYIKLVALRSVTVIYTVVVANFLMKFIGVKHCNFVS